jgi:tRNA modification GTPase
LAMPGEFTYRAFLNGRIDLTQAEAVIDLINAKSDRGLYLASQQIGGYLWNEIHTLRQWALGILAHGEVAIDFPEEEATIMPRDQVADRIESKLVKPIEALIEDHARRKVWIDGVNTVIVGRVNAGKSSLLNRLLNEDRAIVTAIPGTTRDIIESTVSIEGLPLCLMDTAGFREVRDEVERIGIQCTEKKMADADFLLLVIDQSRPLNQDDLNIISQSRGKNALVVMNKIDLPSGLKDGSVNEALSGLPVVKISALTGQGLGQLRKRIAACLLKGDRDMTFSHAAPNLRHRKALVDAAQFFSSAAHSVRDDAPMEIVVVELKSGIDALGEIVGESTSEDVLKSIFSQFCLGK